MAIAPVQDAIETDIPPIALVEEDHEYTLYDDHNEQCDDEDFDPTGQRVAQTRFYRGDGVLISVSELNYPNSFDDEDFDLLCEHLIKGWNNAAAGTASRAPLAAKLKALVDHARNIQGDVGNAPYFAWHKVRAFCSEHVDAIISALAAETSPLTKEEVEAAASAAHDAHWGAGNWQDAGPNERQKDRDFAESVIRFRENNRFKAASSDIDYKAEWEAAARARDEAGCASMSPAEAIAHLAKENAALREKQAASADS